MFYSINMIDTSIYFLYILSIMFCSFFQAAKLLVLSNSVRPHRQQPTRLRHPWGSPGKNTGVGCHFLFQCMKMKSESEVAQSCPTLCNSMDCSLPGSSITSISINKYMNTYFRIQKSIQIHIQGFNI